METSSGTYTFITPETAKTRLWPIDTAESTERLTNDFTFGTIGFAGPASVHLQASSGLSMTASASSRLVSLNALEGPVRFSWGAGSLLSERFSQTGTPWRQDRLDLLRYPLQYQLAVLRSSIHEGSLSLDTNLSCIQGQGHDGLNTGHSFELEALLGCSTTPLTRWGLYAAGLRNVEDTLSYGASLGKRTYFTAGPSFSYTTPSWATNIRLLKDFIGENYPQAWQVSLRVNWAF